MRNNIILNTDSYKASHWLQYPPGTETVYSYIEARGGRFDRLVFFGLQMFLMKYLSDPITQEDIEEAAILFKAHGEPFNREGWEYILQKHEGRLPVIIRAVPEGTVLPIRNVLLTIENTDPKCFWLPSYLETALVRAIWYATTVCTTSYHCKRIIRSYLDQTCDNPEAEILYKLHDFGARGVSSRESAGIGGLAHLVNFRGTDTVEAVRYGKSYYFEEMAATSIPAAEHSTITSWCEPGTNSGETAAYRNMLKQFGKPGALVAVVSDSYDIYNAIENLWGDSLKAEVLAMGGRLIVRPDSGNPHEVVLRSVMLLGKSFGHTTNAKGYKVLHPSVRVIQGDGITIDSIPGILDRLVDAGWSTENVAFGMGGGLLQQCNRDTMSFAMKCSAIKINGEWRDVYKSPVTDSGKRSKKGRLALITEDRKYETVPIDGNYWRDILKPVYRDGALVDHTTLSKVRQRADRPMIGGRA